MTGVTFFGVDAITLGAATAAAFFVAFFGSALGASFGLGLGKEMVGN